MEYVTSTGIKLQLGRIPRARIDRFVGMHQQPEPPTIAVETWADDTEDVPNYKDEGYQQELSRYYLDLGKQHVSLIADAVTLPDGVDFSEVDELQEIGLGSGGVVDFLRYMLHDQDVQLVVGAVLYQSTVTDQGLAEASARYNVRWGKRKLDAFVIVGKSKGGYGAEFEARRAAQFGGIAWERFCEMDGPQQSDGVAFFRLSMTLDWLQSKEASRKK